MKSYIKNVLSKLSKELPLISKQKIDSNQICQRQLFLHYKWLHNQKLPLPNFRDIGFRVYSQNDEDGLLLYIFSLLGTTNKVLVDVAFASPYGANTTNLICNWGWSGLLVHGSKSELSNSKNFFESHPDTYIVPPKLIHTWVTAENINETILNSGFSGEIDLFSLDIDGMDYWVWRSLNAIQPRVVVVECQTMWGPEKSVTIPYKRDFNRFDVHPDYFGASLSAFVKLGREKGYRLIGSNRYGFNAFFIQNGINEDVFPEIVAEECFAFISSDLQQKRGKRLQNMKNYEWIEV